MNKLVNLTLLLLYCSFIFWVSSQPSIPVDMIFPHQDKIHHMAGYFILGSLASRFFSNYVTKQSFVFIFSLCFCSLYGVSDEWHQSFVPGREADVLDWVADTLGALISLTFLYSTKKNKLEKNQLLFSKDK